MYPVMVNDHVLLKLVFTWSASIYFTTPPAFFAAATAGNQLLVLPVFQGWAGLTSIEVCNPAGRSRRVCRLWLIRWSRLPGCNLPCSWFPRWLAVAPAAALLFFPDRFTVHVHLWYVAIRVRVIANLTFLDLVFQFYFEARFKVLGNLFGECLEQYRLFRAFDCPLETVGCSRTAPALEFPGSMTSVIVTFFFSNLFSPSVFLWLSYIPTFIFWCSCFHAQHSKRFRYLQIFSLALGHSVRFTK